MKPFLFPALAMAAMAVVLLLTQRSAGGQPSRAARGSGPQPRLGPPGPRGLFASEELRTVMSFNLQSAASTAPPWEERRDITVALLREYQPLFLGTQEGLRHQLDFLREQLPGYASTGVSRLGNTEDEYCALFYDSRRARHLRGGTFWLSETPDVPASLSWGSGHPRIATWGEFQVEGSSHTLYVFNTHLAFEEPARTEQARVLLRRIGTLVPAGAEVLLTGDFNIPRLTHVWKLFTEAGFQDAWQLARHSQGPDYTFHGWAGLEADLENVRIDWILHRPPGGTRPPEPELLAQVSTWNREGRWPSDHFPVLLTNLGRPQVRAEALRVSKESVKADEPFTVSAWLVNRGQRGATAARLFIDRELVESTWLIVEPRERQQVHFTRRLYEPGAHEVSIELLPGQRVEVTPAPAALELTRFTVERYATPGQVLALTAEVRNPGSFLGTREFTFSVEGKATDSTLVIVPAGEARKIGFVHAFPRAGLYTVSVGERSAQVAVLQPLTGPWLFREGDALSWRSGPVDELEWQQVQLPASWEQTSAFTQDNVYGWYRKGFTVPEAWRGKDVLLLLGRIDDVDVSYLNGEKIGQTGRFPEEAGGFMSQWNVVREYRVPSRHIRYGQENTLAIRVYDRRGGGGLHGGPLGLLPLAE